MTIAKMYRKAVKTSGTKKYARKFYKATGLVNPIKKGKISTTRLIKDVAYLKSVLNPEKKEITGSLFNNSVGQVNGNSSGHQAYDVTPIVSQGVTGQTRNGNSIKIHSMVFKGQILQQASNHHQGKIKFQLYLNKGTSFAAWTGADIAQILSPNPINSIYDINSSRATDTFKNWVLLKTKVYNIKQDNYSGVQGWVDFTIPLKFKSYHVKYGDDNTNAVTNGQLIMVVTADSGNRSSTIVSSVSDIPVLGINTGFDVKLYQKYWFYDN